MTECRMFNLRKCEVSMDVNQVMYKRSQVQITIVSKRSVVLTSILPINVNLKVNSSNHESLRPLSISNGFQFFLQLIEIARNSGNSLFY